MSYTNVVDQSTKGPEKRIVEQYKLFTIRSLFLSFLRKKPFETIVEKEKMLVTLIFSFSYNVWGKSTKRKLCKISVFQKKKSRPIYSRSFDENTI